MTLAARTTGYLVLMATTLAAALWALPARWMMAWIPEASPVRIVDASGTMWNASATVAIGVGGLRRTLPDRVHWKLTFSGGPQLVIRHPWLQGPLKLAPGWSGVQLSAQSLQLPATALTAVHAIFNTLDPGGMLVLSWPDLTIGRSVSGQGNSPTLLTGHWRNASSSLSRIKPMGDYTLTVNKDSGSTMALALRTRKGPLIMEGSGVASHAGAQFDGRAWVDESASQDTRQALQGLLAAIGPINPRDGSVAMKIR